MSMGKPYNTTQLNPDQAFERHVYHRDVFGHFLRWSHTLKRAKIGMKILDVGCGSGNLYEVFYRNRYAPARFVGLDIRNQTIEKNKLKFPKAEWMSVDLVKQNLPKDDWDIISSYELAEHIGKQNVPQFLDNIKKVMSEKTVLLISTPCHDGTCADNHRYDSGDGRGVAPQELTFEEMKSLLEERFTIEKVYGTFASIKDYKHLMNDWQQKMFDELSSYYDSNILSVMMAPFFPAQSRNALWVCKLRSR
uniref:Putative methyltransferase n=1 Tax=viral metagenome TaxID=1070528 RepID=A0A6H1ZGE3_9ZZZZ